MKSVISATASGWLSLTPRSSRRRATMAAMAISSLSFSRGVRFIELLRFEPESRQRSAVERGEHGGEVAAQRGAVAGAQARDREAVPGRDADLAGKRPAARAPPRRCGSSPGTTQHGRDRAAAAPRPPARASLRGDRAVEPHDLGEHQPAAAPDAPAVDSSPCSTRSPMAERPNTTASASTSAAPSAQVDVDAAVEPRAVEQDRLLRQPAQGRAGADLELDRRRRSRRPRER